VDATDQTIVESIRARRKLAVSMLSAFKAEAFDTSPTAEDVAFFENEVAECDAKLAEMGDA
jgi:hypothetical protein